MDLGQLVILSLVEGVTEFLPISSTGHLILTSHLLALPQTEFLKTFEISVQLGAILSIMVLFWKKITTDWEVLKRIIWVSLPTGILGLMLYRLIKDNLIGNLMITVWALILGGVIIILIEKMIKNHQKSGVIKDLNLFKSIILGVIQTFSVIPGVSRSATTIFGGMALGLSRKEATELSFLVAVPIMAAATGYDLLRNYSLLAKADVISLALGIAISFVAATVVVKWLLRYVSTQNFIIFGLYRIIVGLLFLLVVV